MNNVELGDLRGFSSSATRHRAPASSIGGGGGGGGAASKAGTRASRRDLFRTAMQNPTTTTTRDYVKVVSRNPVFIAGLVAVAVLLLLVLQPPMVETRPKSRIEEPHLSFRKLVIWSAVAGGSVLALPPVYKFIQSKVKSYQ